MSKITVYTKDGYKIGDIRAATIRSWTLASSGVIGECKFDMSKRDEKTSDKYLRFGQYIVVSDDPLPEWTGIIYTPRSWGVSTITVTAYQLEKIFQWRSTPDETWSGTPGQIYSQLVGYANANPRNEKPMTISDIYTGGEAIDEKLGDNMYSHIQGIAEDAGHDFEVVHSIDENGRLSLKTSWLKQIGIATGRTLQEAYNIDLSQNILEEQDDLWNEVTGFSDASTKASRFTITEQDLGAIGKYGLYQFSEVFDGVKNETTLHNSVLSRLADSIEPTRSVNVTAVDVGDTYDYLRVGNTWKLKLINEGFSGTQFGLSKDVRILGMEVDDLYGNVKLAAEVTDA